MSTTERPTSRWVRMWGRQDPHTSPRECNVARAPCKILQWYVDDLNINLPFRPRSSSTRTLPQRNEHTRPHKALHQCSPQTGCPQWACREIKLSSAKNGIVLSHKSKQATISGLHGRVIGTLTYNVMVCERPPQLLQKVGDGARALCTHTRHTC